MEQQSAQVHADRTESAPFAAAATNQLQLKSISLTASSYISSHIKSKAKKQSSDAATAASIQWQQHQYSDPQSAVLNGSSV